MKHWLERLGKAALTSKIIPRRSGPKTAPAGFLRQEGKPLRGRLRRRAVGG